VKDIVMRLVVPDMKLKMKIMKKITNHWISYYLDIMRHSFWMLTEDRELTEEQYDKIKKTLNSFIDKFKQVKK